MSFPILSESLMYLAEKIVLLDIMEFQRFKKKRKPNNKRGFILAIALLVIIYLWMNAEKFITSLFG